MIVNAPDSPVQAEVVFVIEATAASGAYIHELKTNYIIPTLEYFHGGALEDGGGSGSVYVIVSYQAADCHPGLPVASYGPFTSPQNVLETVDKIQFIGGQAESRACVTEALATALNCFEDLGRSDIPRHVLLVCCSPPYLAYAGGLVPPGCPATMEQAARLLNDHGVQVSIAASRRISAWHTLYEHAGGELHQAQQRNYAKDSRHLVLLRGYSLKERPPSPAPPPVLEIQADVTYLSPQGRGTAPQVRGAAPPFQRVAPARPNWLPPPRQQLFTNNSALLNQLTQPSYPPPPPQAQQGNMSRLPGMIGNIPVAQVAPTSVVAPAPAPVQASQRTYIWSGVIEWMEKGKAPGEQQKVTKILPCQVSASSKDIEPELKVDTWPNKLLMQLMPKHLISSIGGPYLKDSKSVLLHLQQNEALDALTKVMINGFAGCVHFSPMSMPPQCDIKVLILLYTQEKKAFLGFIPNNQAMFVDRLRKVIQQQKMTHIINKQLPGTVNAPGGMGGNVPVGAMPGSSNMSGGGMPASGMSTGGMSTGGMPSGSMQPGNMGSGVGMPGGMQVGGVGQMSVPGPSQGMVKQQMQQHQYVDSMAMMGGGMGGQVGGKGPMPVTQLDGLEAARQQNLEKIQHLQQTLEAAQQQEAQFKSQMDIMSHLHAAQKQEQHYKQLEEQQRKHQLQQQLQQQLRGATGVGHSQRMMRPIMPSNPGLKHLLQQQPQYRAGSSRAPPPQQFDEVSSYSDFL